MKKSYSFSQDIRQLQEHTDRQLGLLNTSDRPLTEARRKAVEALLNFHDAANYHRLLAEHRRLAAGGGVVSDVAVPAIYERTVVREALHQIQAFEFADVGADRFGPSVTIPYSYRDTTAAGRDNTRRYEGQEIARAGMIQASDTAYPIPQKLAFEVSDEVRYLTAARTLNWDAVVENQRNASRIVLEDTEQVILNEMLQASDEFGAAQIADEALTGVDGANRIFVLAGFPVARPRRIFDLQGNQIGNTANPIAVSYGGQAREEYDGTGTQVPGVYYILNYNLGEIRFVDEAGALLTPPNATAITVAYSCAFNTYNFDTDLPANIKTAEHWDDFLYRYAARKNEIQDIRFHTVNFGLMSGAVMTAIEQAKTFGANFKHPGTELEDNGDLGRIKDVPNWRSPGVPGIAIGDTRVLIGERKVTRYRLVKPWQLEALVSSRGLSGRFTGKKEAYGAQWIVVHTPEPLKRALTTITLYSASARVNRPEL